MTKTEIKSVFGSLTALGEIVGKEPQAISQWFDGELLADVSIKTNKERVAMIVGAARLARKPVPKEWLKKVA